MDYKVIQLFPRLESHPRSSNIIIFSNIQFKLYDCILLIEHNDWKANTIILNDDI